MLYRTTHALAECEVNILSAKVLTLGHEVVDSFYVTEVDGRRCRAPDRQTQIKEIVLEALNT